MIKFLVKVMVTILLLGCVTVIESMLVQLIVLGIIACVWLDVIDLDTSWD